MATEEELPEGMGPATDALVEDAAAAAARAAADRPSTKQCYYVAEDAFWLHRHLPRGSVITHELADERGGSAGEIALLVTSTESDAAGVWVTVQFLGCEPEDRRKKLQAHYRKGDKKVHICYPVNGKCGLDLRSGTHIKEFEWYPRGTFNAPYLSRSAKKKVVDAAGLGEVAAPPSGLGIAAKASGLPPLPPDGAGLPTPLEERLGILRTKAGNAFASVPRRNPPPPGDPLLGPPRVYIPGWRRPAPRGFGLCAGGLEGESSEEESFSQECKEGEEGTAISGGSQPGHGSGGPAKLWTIEQEEEEKEEGQAQSFRVKEKAKEELILGFRPERKQQWELERQPDSTLEEEVAKTPRIGVPTSGREGTGTLGAGGHEGKLPELADTLATRLIAVETSTKHGWHMARHLEVHNPEDDGVAPAHVLLEAQRHSRTVDKAGGKGSWPSRRSWASDGWAADSGRSSKQKGAKGKGKKGKAKGKGGQSSWRPPKKEQGMHLPKTTKAAGQ